MIAGGVYALIEEEQNLYFEIIMALARLLHLYLTSKAILLLNDGFAIELEIKLLDKLIDQPYVINLSPSSASSIKLTNDFSKVFLYLRSTLKSSRISVIKPITISSRNVL